MSFPESPEPAPVSDPTDRERAFDELFRAHYPGLCRFAARILGSQAKAEDVIQELFLYIWERHDRIGDDPPSRAYLYRAAHNAAINGLRHLRVERRWAEREGFSGETAEPSAAEELDHDELAAAVTRAVERLPDRCRLIYTLSRQEQLTYQEIAKTLGLSVKTVEAQMARAFRLLRTSLAPFLSTLLAAVRLAG